MLAFALRIVLHASRHAHGPAASSYERSAPCCLLPPQRKYAELGLEPYVAHATFQYSGTPGKRHRFREFMLFEDPPEYYNHENGFVTIE